MNVFENAGQFYECVGGLMDLAGRDPVVGAKIAKSNLVIQFVYTEPDAVTTIDARPNPNRPAGQYVDVIHGPCALTPDITMRMKADISHAFWHGKVNLLAAISKKDIVTKGPLPKVLKLLPAVTPLYKIYPTLLAEKGYEEMIMK